jgi:hypothetical protein
MDLSGQPETGQRRIRRETETLFIDIKVFPTKRRGLRERMPLGQCLIPEDDLYCPSLRICAISRGIYKSVHILIYLMHLCVCVVTWVCVHGIIDVYSMWDVCCFSCVCESVCSFALLDPSAAYQLSGSLHTSLWQQFWKKI